MEQSQTVEQDNKIVVRCGFCYADLTIDDGKHISLDATWITAFGCWLCHYCKVGYAAGKQEVK